MKIFSRLRWFSYDYFIYWRSLLIAGFNLTDITVQFAIHFGTKCYTKLLIFTSQCLLRVRTHETLTIPAYIMWVLLTTDSCRPLQDICTSTLNRCPLEKTQPMLCMKTKFFNFWKAKIYVMEVGSCKLNDST